MRQHRFWQLGRGAMETRFGWPDCESASGTQNVSVRFTRDHSSLTASSRRRRESRQKWNKLSRCSTSARWRVPRLLRLYDAVTAAGRQLFIVHRTIARLEQGKILLPDATGKMRRGISINKVHFPKFRQDGRHRIAGNESDPPGVPPPIDR